MLGQRLWGGTDVKRGQHCILSSTLPKKDGFPNIGGFWDPNTTDCNTLASIASYARINPTRAFLATGTTICFLLSREVGEYISIGIIILCSLLTTSKYRERSQETLGMSGNYWVDMGGWGPNQA